MARDDRLLVRFQAKYLDPAVMDRLWRELLDHVIEQLGADSFSTQLDLLEESIPARAGQARDSLIAHTALQPPRRSFLGLRPPRWPIDPATRKWIEEGGPWIYRLTIWRGDVWVLQSEMWGGSFQLLARQGEWTRPQSEKPWLVSLDPAPTSLPVRKEGERVRRGWSILRPIRTVVALIAGTLIGLGAAIDEGLSGLWAGLVGAAVIYLELPNREPGPTDRFIARARYPSDPRFERRLERTLGLAVVGFLLGGFAIPLALVVAEPGSGWRLAFWGLAVAGGIVAFAAVGVTVWWTFKYRRREPPQA